MPSTRLPRVSGPQQARLKVIASALVATLVLGSLAAFAYLSRGYPAHRVDLNDAGIWVTNDSNGLFGRLNKSASSLDAYFNPQGGAQSAYTLDIEQDQGTVLAWDKAVGQITPVDVASARLVTDSAVPLPSTMVMDMRAGTVAVLDPASGKIWGTRYDVGAASAPNLTALAGTSKPLAEISPLPKGGLKEGARFSALAVDASGAIHAADITGKAVTIAAQGGSLGKPVARKIAARESLDLTAVGGRVVFLDVIGGTLAVDDQQPTKRPEIVAGSRVQLPGPAASEVLVAAPKALYGFSVSTPQATARVVSDAGAGAPAAPVRVKDCVYGAWAGSPGTVVKGCGAQSASLLNVANAGAVLTRPVFRVNRSAVVVNDAADGQIYDLDSLQRVDNWDQVKDAATEETVVDQQLVEQEKEKPKANRDDLGARPGRTTILYVMDNDTDKGGRILSISSVTQPGNANASVRIAPDGQALIYILDGKGGDSEFTYQLSNGVAEEKGQVRVEDRGLSKNSPPNLKAGSVEPTLTVASGGTLPIQVLDQWRDPDGDPVALASAEVSAGTTNLTSDGRIELTAAATSEAAQAKVTYAVSDGRSDPVEQPLPVNVLGASSIKSAPIVTQPDVARGEVGRAITLTPLMNDIPGADPLNPKAVMKLAAPVAATQGLKVQTDVVSGQVSVASAKPGHFFLEYAAAFGSAAVTKGALRVDVDPPKEDDRLPVAVPDKAVVRGTGSVLVDVLSNDSDPLGSILTVQSATAANPSELKVAVVDGRWLKVTPSTAAMSENPTFVTYRISNGVTQSVDGTVAITQLPTASPDQILVRQDYGTVRTGDATTIRVLENDAALSGATLQLLGDVPGAEVAGRLKVYNPGATDATGGNVGAAYVAGDAVRFVAPQGLTEPMKVIVEYVAQTQTDARDQATGLIEVTVVPEPTATLTNQPPAPRPVEVRAVSGETVTVPIDPTNADPDGDSTSVVGIASAPALGRILGFSPTGITYQAYPDASLQGTDSFSYLVTDRFGATAASTVRVGITPPSAPQLPVPAPLSVTATPGANVTLYPLASASFGKTDPVTVLPLDRFGDDLPEGASLDSTTQSIRAVAGSAKDRPVQFSYGLTGNAGKSAPATVTVFALEGYRNPPRLQDTTVKPDGSGKATVDVLAKAFDPDGDVGKLKVTSVGHPEATISGGRVTVPVTTSVRAIPYEVTDESGATAAAVIHVPTEGAGGPYLRAGKTITVEEGKSVTVNVADYVDDPQGKPVTLTLKDLIVAGPGGKVTATAPSGTQLTVTGAAGYIGPGAVVAEFTNAALDDPAGIKAFVSIPVQVGPETPVLRCPSDVIPVVRGGEEVPRDITSLCSVWSPTEKMADSLSFEGSWAKPLDGVSIRNGRVLVIDASSDSKPGASGVIAVTAAGTRATPSNLNVLVQEAPLATMSPISLPEMKAGEAREVDLTAYFSSPLKDPKPTGLSISKSSGQGAQSSVTGMTARITPDAASFGRMEFAVVMTDVTEKDATDRKRRVTGTIGFDVFTKPDAPGQPQLQATMISRSVTLSWPTPASNGAPIQGYEVSWSGGTLACAASPCVIAGLTNGQDYSFKVRAKNKADWSDWSPSVSTTQVNRPNARPLTVVATQTVASDKSVTLTWPSAQGEGSAITDYIVAVNGRTQSVGSALTGTFSVPANGPAYTFTIVAQNNSTKGSPGTVVGYAAGAPQIGSVAAVQANPAAPTTRATLNITANGVDRNGPDGAAVTYTFFRDGTPLPGCQGVSAPSCTDPNATNGETYRYSAQATSVFLGTHGPSAPVSGAAVTPVGKPGDWAQPVVARAANLSNGVTVSYTVPPSNMRQSTVTANMGGGWVGVPSPGAAGGAASTTLTGTNGGGQVQLRVCNEAGECSVSGPVPYNAYGDMGGLAFSTSSVSGTTVCVAVTGNGGGWNATLAVNGPGVSRSVSGKGSMATPQACHDAGYSATVTYTATLTDTAHPNGEPGRSTKTVTVTRTTPDPPPPPPSATVSLSKGASAVGQPNCDTASCRFVVATTANFTSNVNCSIDTQQGNAGLVSWQQGPNQTRQTPNYFGYPGNWVRVTCTDGQGHSATGQMTW